jgi:hypothetical protein
MDHAEYTFAMPYEFLHHLSCAPLPVRIYDSVLIRKAHGYQSRGFLIAEHNNKHQSINRSIAIIEITRTGHRMVRQYLRESKISQTSANKKFNRLIKDQRHDIKYCVFAFGSCFRSRTDAPD